MNMLGDNIKIFAIKGITIIANRNNGMIIGLDRQGEALLKMLQSNSVEFSLLSANQIKLYKVLEENGFLANSYNESTDLNSIYLHVNSACNLHCLRSEERRVGQDCI